MKKYFVNFLYCLRLSRDAVLFFCIFSLFLYNAFAQTEADQPQSENVNSEKSTDFVLEAGTEQMQSGNTRFYQQDVNKNSDAFSVGGKFIINYSMMIGEFSMLLNGTQSSSLRFYYDHYIGGLVGPSFKFGTFRDDFLVGAVANFSRSVNVSSESDNEISSTLYLDLVAHNTFWFTVYKTNEDTHYVGPCVEYFYTPYIKRSAISVQVAYEFDFSNVFASGLGLGWKFNFDGNKSNGLYCSLTAGARF